MSWGERSCKHYANYCPVKNVTMIDCSVECTKYEWDNITEPDSQQGFNIEAIKNSYFDMIDRHKKHRGRNFNDK